MGFGKSCQFVGAVLLSIGLSACEFDSKSIQEELRNSARILLGKSASSSSGSTPSSGSSGNPDEAISDPAKTAKANAELLRELLQVVFMREPRDRAEFGNWADTLNQGASLEGVYNGMTHSAEYRKLEAVNAGASPEALKVFGQELAYLEIELPVPTPFDSRSASPLPVLGDMSSGVSGDQRVIEFQKPAAVETKPDLALMADKYSKLFVGASIFTLKRVISDEALKVVGTKTEYREKLAIWYSRWAVRLTQRNVDFGVSLRNKADEAFHFKWALQNPEDRIKWEILNRLHRLLNEANKEKQ
jgi:hypothetical protein